MATSHLKTLLEFRYGRDAASVTRTIHGALPFHAGKMIKRWETRAGPEVSCRCGAPPRASDSPSTNHPAQGGENVC